MTEDDEQAKFFSYCKVACRCGWQIADYWASTGKSCASRVEASPLPQLSWVHAIPNGGSRDSNRRVAAIRGANLKRTGLRSGVADIFVPAPAGNKAGLYIEMKRASLKPKRAGSKGGLSDQQIAFGVYVKEAGYEWVVAYGWRDAVCKLQDYFGVRNNG